MTSKLDTAFSLAYAFWCPLCAKRGRYWRFISEEKSSRAIQKGKRERPTNAIRVESTAAKKQCLEIQRLLLMSTNKILQHASRRVCLKKWAAPSLNRSGERRMEERQAPSASACPSRHNAPDRTRASRTARAKSTDGVRSKSAASSRVRELGACSAVQRAIGPGRCDKKRDGSHSR